MGGWVLKSAYFCGGGGYQYLPVIPDQEKATTITSTAATTITYTLTLNTAYEYIMY